MAQFDLRKQRSSDPRALGVPAADEVTHKLAMLIEGECEGLGPLQAAKNSTSASNATFNFAPPSPARRDGTAESETRPQNQLPPHARSRPPGGPIPLSRPRRLAASHRPKTRAERMDDQHPQRGTCAGRLRAAKKTPQVPPQARARATSRRGSPRSWSGTWRAIHSASNAAFVSDWRIRSATTWPACGCWSRNTCGWGRGICSAPGRVSPRNAWSPAGAAVGP